MNLERELARLLRVALHEPEERARAVRTFQDTVADTPTSAEAGKEEIWDVYNELALDLEFYEPDAGWRAASRSYFGNERLEELLRAALARLAKLGGDSW